MSNQKKKKKHKNNYNDLRLNKRQYYSVYWLNGQIKSKKYRNVNTYLATRKHFQRISMKNKNTICHIC